MSGSRTVGIGLGGLNAVDHPSDGVSVGGVGNGDGDVALDGAGDDSLRSGVALDDGAGHAVLSADVELLGVGESGGGAVSIDVVDRQSGGLDRGEVDLTVDDGDLVLGEIGAVGEAAVGIGGLDDGDGHRQIVAALIMHDAVGIRGGNGLPVEDEATHDAALGHAETLGGAEIQAQPPLIVVADRLDGIYEGGDVGSGGSPGQIVDGTVELGGPDLVGHEIVLIVVYKPSAGEQLGTGGNAEIPSDGIALGDRAGVLLFTGEGDADYLGLGGSEVDLTVDNGDVVLFEIGAVGEAAVGIGGLDNGDGHRQIVAVLILHDALGGGGRDLLPVEGEAAHDAACRHAETLGGAEIQAQPPLIVVADRLEGIYEGGNVGSGGGAGRVIDGAVEFGGHDLVGLEIVLIVVYKPSAGEELGSLGYAEIPCHGIAHGDRAGILLFTGEGDGAVELNGLFGLMQLIKTNRRTLGSALGIWTEIVVRGVIGDAAIACGIGLHRGVVCALGIDGDREEILRFILVGHKTGGTVPVDAAVYAELFVEDRPSAVALILEPPYGVGIGIDDLIVGIDGDVGSAHPAGGYGAVHRLGIAAVGSYDHVVVLIDLRGGGHGIVDNIGSRGYLGNGNVHIGDVAVITGDVGVLNTLGVGGADVGDGHREPAALSGDRHPLELDPEEGAVFLAAHLDAAVVVGGGITHDPGVGLAGYADGIAGVGRAVKLAGILIGDTVVIGSARIILDGHIELRISRVIRAALVHDGYGFQISAVILEHYVERIQRSIRRNVNGEIDKVAHLGIVYRDSVAIIGHGGVLKVPFGLCEDAHRYQCQHHESRNDHTDQSSCHCFFLL